MRFEKSLPMAAALCMGLYGAFTDSAKAAESIAAAGPIGGSDISSAFLPEDGLWISGIYGSIGFRDYRLDDGSAIPGSGGNNIGGIGALYVWPEKFAGGTLASSLFIGYDRMCFGVGGAPETCTSGFKDIYSDVLMWSKFSPSPSIADQIPGKPFRPYGTAVLIGLGLTIPTAKFESSKPINNGYNIWGISPNIAITHTMKSPLPALGEALEISGRLYYHSYSENGKTDFQTGDVVSLDWAVTAAKGSWKYGLAGLAYQQIEDDKIAGATHPNNGNRSSVSGWGPIISYDFMSGDRPINITAKGIYTESGDNVVATKGVFIRLSTKF